MPKLYFGIILRVAIGVILMLSPVVAGAQYRSPWLILLLAAVFFVLSVASKWALWCELWSMKGPAFVARRAVVAALMQVLPVGLLYLLGLGLGALLGEHDGIRTLTQQDLLFAGMMLVIGAVMGVAIAASERDRQPLGMAQAALLETLLEAAENAENAELEIDEAPVTARNVFALSLLRHGGATEEELRETEARLGFALPAQLADLYRIANGGPTAPLVVPVTDDPDLSRKNWTAGFKGDYLNGLEEIVGAAWEYIDDIPDGVSPRSTFWIIADVDNEVTALVPTEDGALRVIVCDFDGRDPVRPISFQSFDAFMRALRRVVA